MFSSLFFVESEFSMVDGDKILAYASIEEIRSVKKRIIKRDSSRNKWCVMINLSKLSHVGKTKGWGMFIKLHKF